METDKVSVEIESPHDGLLHEIRAQEGALVKFGSIIDLIKERTLSGIQGLFQL
jgi:pyruvate/2-oxoglutarate dehydrogenase complex dihydrolipoamide acyltransferase (E2) component